MRCHQDSDAGWSSLVARWAHNPKVAGSNPAPATNIKAGQPAQLRGRPKWSPSLRSWTVTEVTKPAKSRQTRDIFERPSGFHAAGKRQFFAHNSRLGSPAQASRLPPLP